MKVPPHSLLLGLVLSVSAQPEAEHEVTRARGDGLTSAQKQSSALRRRDLYSNRGHRASSKTTRVIVEYANDAARDHATGLSKRVYHHSKTQMFVAVEIETSLVPELEARQGINAIHSDGLFYAQGYLEEEVSLPDHNDRLLFQTTPYGISMVQADQVDVGQSPVRVCIPDTGALRKHPDLPEKLMRGANRYSSISGDELRWRRDVRGHGTHTAGKVCFVRGCYSVPEKSHQGSRYRHR